MVFHLRLLSRLRCLLRTWRNFFAVVLLLLCNFLIVGNITRVCHGKLSLILEFRSSLKARPCPGKSFTRHAHRTQFGQISSCTNADTQDIDSDIRRQCSGAHMRVFASLSLITVPASQLPGLFQLQHWSDHHLKELEKVIRLGLVTTLGASIGQHF